MKLSAKLFAALFTASLALGTVGCGSQEQVVPTEMKAAAKAGGAEISIAEFVLAKPDFLDNQGHYAKPAEGQEEVAILRVKIKNTSSAKIDYKPLHNEGVTSRIQLCTEPELGNEKNRTNFKAISFGSGNQYHTAKQQVGSRIEIEPGHEIIDEYLFEPPVVGNQRMVAIVPGQIVGANNNLVFYVDKPGNEAPVEPSSLRSPATLDGLSVTVTDVREEYAVLESDDTSKQKGLKYPYAYTKKPVMAVYVSIKNNGNEPRSYDPQHKGNGNGVSMLFANGAINRIRIESAHGKDQVTANKIAINPGDSITDVYYFDAPASDGKLDFSLSGHLFSVRGIYRFRLNFQKSNPSAPDLKPYLKAAGEGNAEGAADAPAADAAAEAEETAEESAE